MSADRTEVKVGLKQLCAEAIAVLHQGRLDVWLTQAEANLPGVKREGMAIVAALLTLILLMVDTTGPLVVALVTLGYPMVDAIMAIREGNGADRPLTAALIICLAANLTDVIFAGGAYRVVKTAMVIVTQPHRYRLATLVVGKLAGQKKED